MIPRSYAENHRSYAYSHRSWGDSSEAGILNPLLELTSFQAGEAAAQRHQSGDSFYIVVDGILTTMIRVNLSSGIKKATRLFTAFSCMCFAEIGFLTGQPRSADVIALLRAFSSELASKLASDQLTLLDHYGLKLY